MDQLGEGLDLPPAFVDWIQAQHETARAIIATGDIVTCTEGTPVRDIETLTATRNIKRVPVLREGRIVDIVCRSDPMRLLSRMLNSRAAATVEEARVSTCA